MDIHTRLQRRYAARVERGASCCAGVLFAGWLAIGALPADAQSSADVCYRGWLQSERGLLAVLTREGRDLVVAVGESVGPEWKVISIDAASVELENRAKNRRKRLWFGGAGTAASGDASSAIEGARVHWDAPPVVEPGSIFSVVLLAPGLDLKGGQFILEYDPSVLAIADAIGEEEDYGGRARLPVREGGGDYLAEVTFQVVARDPTATRLRLDEVMLIGWEGEALSVAPGNDLTIQVTARPESAPHAATGR